MEFSPEDFKKVNKSYNLRVKKSPSFGRDSNDNYYYFMTSSKNNSMKIIKQENENNSPQQQISSTNSSTFKNIYNEDFSDGIKSKSKLNHKRKRDDGKDKYNFINTGLFEQLNSKNKKIKK